MLVIFDRDHYEAVRQFAREAGALERLDRQIARLDTYNGPAEATRCTLVPDFFQHSFTFVIERPDGQGGWTHVLTGGLIYSGPDALLGGASPALTVSLDPDSGQQADRSIHT